MRTFLLFAFLFAASFAQAQTVATFESLNLPKQDTFYVNYSAYGTDVGFDDGYAHFPCVYDTSWGFTFWSYGFAYSNMTDSVTSGPDNQYSAKTATGYNGSAQYVVATGQTNIINLKDSAQGKNVNGFYVTNNTYAYNSMRDGDPFAKPFGGITGSDPDFFMLTIKGYENGSLKADSVDFYLADYRDADDTKDYIVNTWEWIDLTSLGHIDSLHLYLSSSDTGVFGMNTPAYFCMDNFTTNETSVSVGNTPVSHAAKVYPNPATDMLYVEMPNADIEQIVVMDMSGKVVTQQAVSGTAASVQLKEIPAGNYILQLSGNGIKAVSRFVKQ